MRLLSSRPGRLRTPLGGWLLGVAAAAVAQAPPPSAPGEPPASPSADILVFRAAPTAAAAESTGPSGSAGLARLADGSIDLSGVYIGGRAVQLLGDVLLTPANPRGVFDPGHPVRIVADRELPWEEVVRVFQAASGAGFRAIAFGGDA